MTDLKEGLTFSVRVRMAFGDFLFLVYDVFVMYVTFRMHFY